MRAPLLLVVLCSGCLYDSREGDLAAECRDGIDGDHDGRLDCAETDCDWTRFCRGPDPLVVPGGVVNQGGDHPPVAVAGPSYLAAQPGERLALDGSDSYDPDGDGLTFVWRTLTSPPTTRSSLQDADHAIAHVLLDRSGFWKFELIVTANGVRVSKQRTVEVRQGNQPPWADAGPDQTVHAQQTALLNGLSSGDPDHNPITYEWRIVSSPERSVARLVTTLNDPYATLPTDLPGEYVIALQVNDGGLRSEVSYATVTATR